METRSKVLLGLALYDFIRGLLHTVFCQFATKQIANVPGSITDDYYIIMNAFGYANFFQTFIKMYAVYNKDTKLMKFLFLINGFLTLLGSFANLRFNVTADYPGRYVMFILGIVNLLCYFEIIH